jgi:hypothetical protein
MIFMLVMIGVASASTLSWGEVAEKGFSAELYHAWGNQLYEQGEYIAAEVCWQRGLFLAPWSSELRGNLELVGAEHIVAIHPSLSIPIFSLALMLYFILIYKEERRGRPLLWFLFLLSFTSLAHYFYHTTAGRIQSLQRAYSEVEGQGESRDLPAGERVTELQSYGAELQVQLADGSKFWIPSSSYLSFADLPMLEKVGEDVK